MDLYSSFSLNYLRPIFTTTQTTATSPTLFFSSKNVSENASKSLSSASESIPHQCYTSVKSLTSKTTEMDNKTFTEQELLEGLDAYTAHADELVELVEVEVDLDKVEEDCSH